MLNHGQLFASAFHDLCREYERPFIIDIGSHVGTSLIAVAGRGNACGWAFEPHPVVFELLCRKIELHGMSNRFTAFQKALSHFPGRRILKSPLSDSDSALSCMGQPNYVPYREQYVDVVRLDDLVEDTALESIEIINIDTEGSELFVLIGASETVNKYKPDLLMRVNWANLSQSDLYLNNLMDYLELLGYQGHWVGDESMLFRHPYRKSKGKRAFFADNPDSMGLKTAIVKQCYDVFGPWRSKKFEQSEPLKILDRWPSKHSYLEMTYLLQADWFVLPFCHDSKLVRQKIDYHQQTFDDNMEYIRAVDDLPLDDYDVVISLDPVLRPPGGGRTLFAYFQNEHHHSEYTRSVRHPLPGYDLFLDHMMTAPSWVYDLPQPVSFPYPRDPYVVRALSGGLRNDAVWFDKRFVMMLTHGNEIAHRGGFEGTVASLERRFRSRIVFRNLDFEDMTRWGDSFEYMQEMAGCSYYVNLIACGAGQGLCDAASLGLICFGSARLPYHRVVCHPVCLCGDLSELEWKLDMVRSSSDLQGEIRAWQDTALSDMMVTQPLRILQAAVEMKRRRKVSPAEYGVSPAPVITGLVVDELPQEPGLINSAKLKQRAGEQYEKGAYRDAVHSCRQALWFDRRDHELHYLTALASYAAGDVKDALSSVAECLNINEQFRPAVSLRAVLQKDEPAEESAGEDRARVLYLIHNRFDGYNRELDGPRMERYNIILDELLHDSIRQGDTNSQLLIQHHKLRLNRLAAL